MMLLLGLALKSLLIAAATLALLHLTRRRSAADRSWIAHLGLVALVALPLASLALPALSVVVPSAVEAVVPAAPLPATIDAALIDPPTVTTAPEVASTPVDWTRIAYAAPVIALLALTLVALLRLFGLRRRAQVMLDPHWLSALAHAQQRMGFKNGTALLVSSELASPISWGLMRPVILINDEALAASGEAEAIIAHELAHVARFDWAKLMLARVATAIVWFNPLAWVLAREAHQLREEAADDAVLAANVVDTDYAQLLVGIARHEARGLLLGAHGISPGKDSLRRRVRRVLDTSLARGAGGRSWVAGFAAGMLVMSAPLAALTFAPAPPAAPPAPPAPRAPQAAPAPLAPLDPTPPKPPLPRPAPPVQAITATVSKAVTHAVAIAAEHDPKQILGVTPDYIASIRAAGPQFRNLSDDDMIELRVKGVTPEYIRAIAAAGYGNESADEIGDAAVLGLTPDAVRGFAQIIPGRPLGDLAELRMLGVTPDFVAQAQRTEGNALSNERLIELRLLGHRRKNRARPH